MDAQLKKSICSESRFPCAHTFSIVARDPESGQMGVAVQSHWFAVGSVVPHAEAGVGAVATQSFTEPAYGPQGLALMKAGKTASAALAELSAADLQKEVRQVAMVDMHGNVSVHTGQRCIAEAGHHMGEGFSVQANMMLNSAVWPAMADAYRSGRGDLAERLIAALEAAQAVGGDVRGKQSAALLVVAARASGHLREDRLIDLRVDDHPEPIQELRRLLSLQRAYQLMNEADVKLGSGQFEAAGDCYARAAALAPSIAEIPFWAAVGMADLGMLEQALPIFHKIFAADPNLAILVQRLPPSGFLRDDPQMMGRILAELP